MKQEIKWLGIIMILLVGVCLGQTAYADELSDLKQKVREIEEKLDANIFVDDENHGAFIRRFDEIFSLSLYVSLRFENFQGEDAFIDATDFEIISEFQMNDRINAYFEIEFSGEEAEVEQGWFEYALNEAFISRFGVIIVPFGKYNLQHFSFQRDLTSPPIIMEHIVPVTWAEAGAGFSGNLFLDDSGNQWWQDFALNYKFFLINGLTENMTGTSIKEAKGSFAEDNNNNKALVGRLGLISAEGQEIGVSGYFGKYDDGNTKNIIGLDLDWFFVLGAHEFLGEYVHFNLENSSNPVPEKLSGGYIQANTHFWFDILNDTFLGRGYEAPTFTGTLRYGHAEIKSDSAIGANKEKRWTGGLNYRPVETFLVRFEYQFNRSENTPISHGNNNGFMASVVAAF